jgi:hypothetical protein
MFLKLLREVIFLEHVFSLGEDVGRGDRLQFLSNDESLGGVGGGDDD